MHYRLQGLDKTSLEAVVEDGRLLIARFLMEEGVGAQSRCLADKAARCGHLKILKWLYSLGLYENGMRDGSEVGTVVLASRHGLSQSSGSFETCGMECTTDVKDETESYGHLDAIRWLHRRGAACTHAAMDDAAQIGRLHFVRWLHENRSAGCTAYAMVSALTKVISIFSHT
ncbi:hypothetical protein DFJ77DRAFT_537756 [Powellomyces hirtus]|nr:hypothetical protein DFJ77DRAFT_537756 [Powellomyces hirtus]